MRYAVFGVKKKMNTFNNVGFFSFLGDTRQP